MKSVTPHSPVVLLLGRPNVGKSSLFNRLTRSKAALVDDREGVTRDYIEGQWEIPGLPALTLIDLCGFREKEADPVLILSQKHMRGLWESAKMILFVVDARQGVTPTDAWLGQEIRKLGKPVFLLANKVEAQSVATQALLMSELGWQPYPVSAAHGDGIEAFEAVVHDYLLKQPWLEQEALTQQQPQQPLKIAILGKPNVGKSTLLNALIARQRATVSPIAGTTRDAIAATREIDGQMVCFLDTAGIRRKRSIDDQLEVAAVSRSIHAIETADVIYYLIHSLEGISQQDQVILSRIAQSGKGLVILFSQWDLVTNAQEYWQKLQLDLDRLLNFVEYAPRLTLSVHMQHNVHKLLQTTWRIQEQLDREFPTGMLNDVLEEILAQNPPPSVQLKLSRRRKAFKQLRIYYAVQVGRRPLIIRLYGNLRQTKLPLAYERYLKRRLSERLALKDVTMLIEFQCKEGEKK